MTHAKRRTNSAALLTLLFAVPLGLVAPALSTQASAASLALIDRDPNGGGVYAPGYYALTLQSLGVNFDLFGTDPAGQPLQNLYDNLANYDAIIFADNAGIDTGIANVAGLNTNQAALEAWLSNGGHLYVGVFNDAGDTETFLNLPGLSVSANDTRTDFAVVNNDLILNSPNDVTNAVRTTDAWEQFVAFPNASTDQNVILSTGTYDALVSFRYGNGLVWVSGIPVKTTHPNWPGFDEVSPGTGAQYLENVVARLNANVVPETSSVWSIALAVAALFLGRQRPRR